MEKKKVFVYSDICPRRRLDARRTSEYFSKNNYSIINNPRKADIIVFFTCALSDKHVKNALNRIKKFQKLKARLIVTGCLPEIEKEQLNKIFKGEQISTKDLDKIDKLFPESEIKFEKNCTANIVWNNLDETDLFGFFKKILKKSKLAAGAYIKTKDHVLKHILGENSPFYNSLIGNPYLIMISRGCFGNCSYCAIKKAVGPLKSKPLEHCLEEFKNGLEKGYKKFYIVGDDAGAYGMDIGETFPNLLDKITDIPDDYKIQLMDLNPRWVVKYADKLKQILKKDKIKTILVPIQSGSSRILKLMNRFSDVEVLKKILLCFKEIDPDLVLVTHIMVGFPAEAKEEFEKSIEFVKQVGFNTGLLIPFSCKSGTEAEKIEPNISKKEISRRLKYAKKTLKKDGYNVIYFSKPRHFFIFDRE